MKTSKSDDIMKAYNYTIGLPRICPILLEKQLVSTNPKMSIQ